MYNIESIKQKINEIHNNDQAQTEIIFDNAKKIIVEAPAGCGKTKTMISKIAYLIATNNIESTKKILALTFSVNASYKIKKDVSEQLPGIIKCDDNEAYKQTDKIVVSNYHGFCRKILSKYGFFIADGNINFNTITAIQGNNQKLREFGLDGEKIYFINEFEDRIKNNDYEFVKENYLIYNEYIKRYLLVNQKITYNAIILLAYELLIKNDKIKKFYQKLFPVVFIDEFQDTNCISWMFIKEIIGDNTKTVFMGDSLQRIYGFIGAVPNLMKIAENEFNMRKFKLTTNYRFKDNRDMLLLDRNIRLNALKKNNSDIEEMSNPNIIITDSQEKEAKWICDKVVEMSKENKIAILTRNGMKDLNVQKIKEELDNSKIQYFFALFTDEDPDYIKFHEICLNKFNGLVNEKMVVTPKILKKLIDNVENIYTEKDNLTKSLIKLLYIFCNRIFDDYIQFSSEEKIRLIRETFENYALKQNMDKVNEKIILSTIHASKGLEYDNVIIADNEKESFPTYYICRDCYQENKNNYCVNTFNSKNERQFLEELSVFYVGFTRAKNKVFFTMSKKGLAKWGEVDKIGSCFLKLNGVGRENLVRYN
jgi:uvrD/REP helicase